MNLKTSSVTNLLDSFDANSCYFYPAYSAISLAFGEVLNELC